MAGEKKILFERREIKKKEFFCRENLKKPTARIPKTTKEGLFLLLISIQKPKTKEAQILFHLYFSFKTSFKSTKRLQSQFSRQNYNQTVNTLWREINTASTSFSTHFFIIFLFCLISYLIQFILFLYWLFTNHFYYFWYFDGWNGVNQWWRCTKTHGM